MTQERDAPLPDRRTLVIACVIALACFAAFAPAWNAGITNWDDDSYLGHPASKRVSGQTFTAPVMGHYHPLTVLSFAVEQQVFGPDARVLHMTNVALHAVTAALVVWLLALLSASNTVAAAGGFFFAIHPLRVESVLWISERKDVLCLVFFAATLVAYVYQQRGSRKARLLVPLFFLLALFAKALAVSLPFAMLAVDYLEGRLNRHAVVRKVPYVAVALVFALLNLHAARGVVRTAANLGGVGFSPGERLALAASMLVFYLGKLIAPIGLSAYYPYPPALRAGDVVAVISVVAIAAIAIASMRTTRVIAFALGFFAVAVAPTLPLFSSGPTIGGDRVPYAGSIGIAFAIGVAAQWALRRWRRAAAVAISAAAALLLVGTFNRSQVWHDSVTLWNSVIEADPTIAVAWNSRGAALMDEYRDAEALSDIDTAIRLRPCYQKALYNRTGILLRHGQRTEAERSWKRMKACEGKDRL